MLVLVLVIIGAITAALVASKHHVGPSMAALAARCPPTGSGLDSLLGGIALFPVNVNLSELKSQGQLPDNATQCEWAYQLADHGQILSGGQLLMQVLPDPSGLYYDALARVLSQRDPHPDNAGIGLQSLESSPQVTPIEVLVRGRNDYTVLVASEPLQGANGATAQLTRFILTNAVAYEIQYIDGNRY